MSNTKESKREYDKLYRQRNKEKIAKNMKAYYEDNKDKREEYIINNEESIKLLKKRNYEDNKERVLKDAEVRAKSEGVGVYKVVYQSGIYIGSGSIQDRKKNHLNGNACKSQTKCEKAVSFEVLSLTSTRREAYELEQLVIDTLGLDNLLNNRNVPEVYFE